jgi:hypothetical protein
MSTSDSSSSTFKPHTNYISAATQLTAAIRNIAWSTTPLSHYIAMSHRLLSHYSTVYSATIAQSRNTVRSTRPLSLDTAIFTSYHDYFALWYYCYSTKGLLRPTTVPGCWKPIELHHVTAKRIDRSIGKGRLHLGRRFGQTWPKLASRIRI